MVPHNITVRSVENNKFIYLSNIVMTFITETYSVSDIYSVSEYYDAIIFPYKFKHSLLKNERLFYFKSVLNSEI